MGEVKEIPVIWLQGGTCTGCSVSVLNTLYPSIKNVLIDEVIPGKHLSLKFHATIMAGAGDPVIKILDNAEKQEKGFVLVVEGSVATADKGMYCCVGERNGNPVPFKDWVIELSQNALAVIALGTCASFGGIPSARPNLTGAVGVMELFKKERVSTPLINVPGCPPHPDWFIGTVAQILVAGLPKPEELDGLLRLKNFYGKLIHENCPRRAYFDEGKFAKKHSDPYCLYELGCKGPITYADCPDRQWNSAVNWCIKSGAGCQGCTQPEFPDGFGSFYEKVTEINVPRIGDYWLKKEE